jgi:U3 small nucleolar ribonucleoprotein protein LCP5
MESTFGSRASAKSRSEGFLGQKLNLLLDEIFHVKLPSTNTTTTTMAAASLKDVLSSFTASTTVATTGLPDSETLLPPDSGITLLDAKNEIFLSYLQSLALRNLNVLRGIKQGKKSEDYAAWSDKLTRKLVEHRVYLDRGVRPLEQRIKYQVDKVVKAAEDEHRAANQKPQPAANGGAKAKDDSSDDSDDDSDDESAASAGEDIDELSYRPNPAAFAAPEAEAEPEKVGRYSGKTADGVYRPPRISATTMPTTTTEQREKRAARPGHSATVDEYITNELSANPVAQPSIGSNVADRGRTMKNAKALAREAERRNYEETNLVRLPKESKKELAKYKQKDRANYGGEEWKGLGESLDRIGDLTRKKGKDTVLDKSRKRRATEDGPRGDGIGDAFDMKKRRMDKKARR